MSSLAPTIDLRGAPDGPGVAMPRLGLGTWPMDDAQTERAVATAIETRYRLFDTAENYRNERGVGLGMRASGLPRDQLFVTTKFNREWHGKDLVREVFGRSADLLAVDYIDLLLIHWPNPGHDRYVEAWEGMIKLQEEGLVRAIGVSNFKPAHLERLRVATGILPAVNQVQLHPLIARPEARVYHAQHGIVTESWSPVEKGGDLLSHPAITDIAEQHRKTPAQVVLRWHLELGLVPIPKSADPGRMRENIEVFDFTLTTEEIAAISALNRGEGAGADSDRIGH